MLDQQLIERSDFRLFSIYRPRKELLPAQRRDIVVMNAANNALAFAVDDGQDFVHLASKAHHFGEIGSVLAQSVDVLSIQIGVFFLQALQEVVLRDEGHLGLVGLDQLIERFLLHPVALRVGQVAT